MLAQECPEPDDWYNARNFSNDAHDPGGKTMCGITQREYDNDRKRHGMVCRDVRQITETEGYSIYRLSYWSPHCDSLPPGLDLCFFDSSVNEGCTEAVRILQHVLDIEADGMWGPQTAAAVAAIPQVSHPVQLPAIIRAFTARRETVYRESKGFPYFGKDWLRRSKEIGDEALKMVSQ